MKITDRQVRDAADAAWRYHGGTTPANPAWVAMMRVALEHAGLEIEAPDDTIDAGASFPAHRLLGGRR